jgi:hypothetical protein
VKDKVCQLFIEVENQRAELEHVVTIAEQRLEWPLNDVVIQEFTKEEATTKQQVKETQAKLEAFKFELIRPE